jgi:hypothetical protein
VSGHFALTGNPLAADIDVMRSQLRLQVLLPVAVLALLGVGVGAFAFNGSPQAPDDTAAIAARIAAKRAAAKKVEPPKKTETPAKTVRRSAVDLSRALENHSVVVVLFYEPGGAYDRIQTREARAGALAANAGFVAVDASSDREVAWLAQKYEVTEAPAVLIVTRKGLVNRIYGFAERATVAQAAENARS